MSKRKIDPLKRSLDWYGYTDSEIEKHAPTDPGIYFIVREYYDKQAVWVYIGQAEDVQDRLLEHYGGFSDESGWINACKPTTFGVLLVPGGEKRRRIIEDRFIELLNPLCNKTQNKKDK